VVPFKLFGEANANIYITTFCADMIGQQLLAAVLLIFTTALLLKGCKADMNTKKSETSTDQVFSRSDCPGDQNKLRVVSNPAHFLSGFKLEIHKCSKDDYNGYEERFFPNGTWEFDEYGATLITYSGTWRSENGKILINSNKIGKFSRNLYRDNHGLFYVQVIVARKINENNIFPLLISSLDRSKNVN
jgi:hypothetical protein